MGRLFKVGSKMYWSGRVERFEPQQYVHYPYWPFKDHAGTVMTVDRDDSFGRYVKGGYWAYDYPECLALPEGV